MLEKYRKLIIAQIAGILAVAAFFIAFMRYQQTGILREQILGSFLLFGILLLGVEVKCVWDWLRARKLKSP